MIEFISTPVATVLRGIHAVLSQFLIPGSGPAWGLSIVLLTVCVRLVLFPLFVKQIKSQRRMQELAPKIKEVQARHKGDRETLNAELMKLYKDNNANPISGCLPLLLQLPVFFALFSVINEFRPGKDARFGLTAEQLAEGGQAKVFGAPIGAAFNSSQKLLDQLDGDPTTVKLVAALLVVLMGATTYWTQRQMMARAGTTDPQQLMVQKFMLYVLPLSFAVSGFIFPVGVLLYWLTTNVWSMGQQHYVIKRMPPVNLGGTTPGKGGPTGKTDAKPKGPKDPKSPGTAKAAPTTAPTEAEPTGANVLTANPPRPGGSARPSGGSPGARRNAGSRKNKKKGRR